MARRGKKDPDVFILPDLGEGIAEAELIAWKVEVGQAVAEHEIVAEMETDKALVEVPSPRAGVIKSLHGSAGDVLEVGKPLVTYEAGGGGAPGAGSSSGSASGSASRSGSGGASDGAAGGAAGGASRNGDGSGDGSARAEPGEGGGGEGEREDAGSVVGQMSAETPGLSSGEGKVLAAPAVRRLARDLGVELSSVRGTGIGGRVTAKDVRAHAGAEVGSGPAGGGGQAARKDPGQGSAQGSVQGRARGASLEPKPAAGRAEPPATMRASLPGVAGDGTGYGPPGGAGPAGGGAAPGVGPGVGPAFGAGAGPAAGPGAGPGVGPGFGAGAGYGLPAWMPPPVTPVWYAPGYAYWGPPKPIPSPAQKPSIPAGDETAREAFRGVRRTIAERLRASVDTAVHFTVMDEADVTAIDALRTTYEHRGHRKPSFLPFVCAAVCRAVSSRHGGRFGALNARVDEAAHEVEHHAAVHLGVAADTGSGLMVPVIRDADEMDELTLAAAIAEAAAAARDRTIPRERLTGSTFTVSNVGSHAGRFATPVINHPEVAILAVGKVYDGVVVRDGVPAVAKVMPLSLTCDHRVVDGATAALALAEIVRRLRGG